MPIEDNSPAASVTRTPNVTCPLSALERKASLGYADVGLFFVSVFLIAVVIRLAVHFHILDRTTADKPPLLLQAAISMFLIGSLYLTVRVRHGTGARTLLGWFLPDRSYLYAALISGVGLATMVEVVARASTPTSHLIHISHLLLLDIMLGPVVEESFFRGCLVPVLARTAGPKFAILGAAVLFASLHPLKTAVQWACFAVTGIAYGWMRVRSRSTVPAALMHAAYNAALYAWQIL
jgi:membrane protease YdiL (CAAX protease family)